LKDGIKLTHATEGIFSAAFITVSAELVPHNVGF